MKENEAMVSICCLAYNHEPYIRDCLEGFVNQRTNFKYEVLIHDDASTDKTADIIREYEAKYPDIIKPIYQTENQYSKRVKITDTLNLPRAKGKYIAWCEGDDFWIDENKLQKQFDFMQAHPEYSACVHNSYRLNCKTGEKSLLSTFSEDRDLSLEDVVTNMSGFFQTSSVFIKKELAIIPKEFYGKDFSDYQRVIYLALNGKIRYFKDVMSVYRLFSSGSWSEKLSNKTVEQIVEYYQNIIDVLTVIDQYTNEQHHELFSKMTDRHTMNILVAEGKRFPILFKVKYLKAFLEKYNLKTLVYYLLKGKV